LYRRKGRKMKITDSQNQKTEEMVLWHLIAFVLLAIDTHKRDKMLYSCKNK
jgi:hypothetical protein